MGILTKADDEPSLSQESLRSRVGKRLSFVRVSENGMELADLAQERAGRIHADLGVKNGRNRLSPKYSFSTHILLYVGKDEVKAGRSAGRYCRRCRGTIHSTWREGLSRPGGVYDDFAAMRLPGQVP
jgi:hypothetical protein